MMKLILFMRNIQWRIVLLVVKPALIALGVAIVDVGLLDGVMLQSLEEFLREVRLAAAAKP